jgi:Ser/Thr protein kinase RdoA (MazF antagonist)
MLSSDTKQGNDMIPNLKEIFGHFRADGTFMKGQPVGSGHIHDTYRILTSDAGSPGYILQKINTTIFSDVRSLQGNIGVVTRHIRAKLSAVQGADHSRQCLNLIPTHNNATWHADEKGNCWRMFLYITNHRNYDIVDSEAIAFEAGKAIGSFVSMLADLPGNSVVETLPDFHNAEKRIENFRKALVADIAGRAVSVVPETSELLKRSEEMKIIQRLGADNQLPLRITHNDTKINNVLFDENDKALCVIDLDTVMPGFVHYDFGDAIRTAASTAAEDETDLSKVSLSLPFFAAWTQGFLGETKAILTPVEKKYLSFAPRLITYLQAMRFLTDYLNGDTYYKTKHIHHNLQRTRTQLQLLNNMEIKSSEMENIVIRFC